MQLSRTLKELRDLQSRLAYIRIFIVNLSSRYQPFIRLMKKCLSFVWNEACQEVFEDIKEYLTKPLVLAASISGKLFLLYAWAIDHSLGAIPTQKNDEGFEHAVYYLSRILVKAESRYNPVKKECIAFIFVVQKILHYLVVQTICVISRVNPLRILMMKPGSLNSKLANWAILLSQYDMTL